MPVLCVTNRKSGNDHQAPAAGLFAQFAQLIRLDNPHTILFFQCKTPHRAGQLAGFDGAVFARDQFGDGSGQLFDPTGFTAASHQQGRAGDGQLRPVLGTKRLFRFAFDAVVESAGFGVCPNGADDQ